jgi:eukaryotic-like serine/threonine-protein kinase
MLRANASVYVAMPQAPHLESEVRVSTAQLSTAGKKPGNDDSLGLFVPSERSVLALKGIAAVIADGVSGAEAGREAADICVRGFLDDYYATPDCWSVETSAQRVLTSLNRWLFAQGRRYHDAQRGFVCTLSAIVIKSRTLHLFHAGDSRVYCLRRGKLSLLTTDHKLSINSTQSHLSRAMGLDVKLDVDHRSWPVEDGDVYLMTTDGLHDHVQPHDFIEVLCEQADLQAAAQALVERALANDSADNVSCQLLRVEGLPAPQADDVYRALSELPFPPDLKPGMTLDGYRVLRELYASARSQLYAVEDCDTHAKLVMKTPSVRFEDDPEYIERFVMEPWIGSRIRSPHVIRSVVGARPQQFLYHVQEYVDGETLDGWMARNPERDVREVVRIVEQIARGLTALHRQETVHRDLKPDNVMRDAQGEIKIVDLGACYVTGVDEIAVAFQRGAIVGTADYSAPELLAGARPVASSDLYSLGVIAYELLTGELPYGRSPAQPVPGRATRRQYKPAYHHNPLVPVWMDGALRKAVRPEPEVRYSELSEFIHDLSHPNARFMQQGALPLVERNPLRFWRWTAGLLLLSELATLFYFLGR